MNNRSGFALPAVILLMFVLTTVSVFLINASSAQQKIGRAMRESSRSFYTATAGLNQVVAEWDSLRYDTLMVSTGDSLNLTWRTLENGTAYSTRIQRIDGDTRHKLYSVEVQGRAAWGTMGASSNSTVGVTLLWRKVWAMGDLASAIFAADGLKKASNNGMNSGVNVCATDSIGGLIVPIGGLDYSGSPDEVFEGAPLLIEVPDIVQTMDDMGFDWAEILDGNFDYVISSSAQFPDFSTLPPDFYPSILFTGNLLTVKGTEDNGRGLLVVVNDLTMQSDWDWKGTIMVGERFQVNNTITIEGALFSGLDVQLGESLAMVDPSQIGPGETQITYNSCVVEESTGWTPDGLAPLQVVDGSWTAWR